MSWSKHIAKGYRVDLRNRATSAELIFKAFLDKYKFNYIFQEIVMKSKKHGFYIVDFMIKMNPKILIEIDGSSHDGRYKEDLEREEFIKNSKKYKDCIFMRFHNKDVYSGKAQKIIGAIYPKQIKKYS